MIYIYMMVREGLSQQVIHEVMGPENKKEPTDKREEGMHSWKKEQVQDLGLEKG